MKFPNFIVYFSILIICSYGLEAKIYICVDEKGQKHYSDKMCPRKVNTKTEYYTVNGKTIPPKNVTEFTPVIKLARESLALLMLLEPGQVAYEALYSRINDVHLQHTRFLANPDAAKFPGYKPIDARLQQSLIATLSLACRMRGHMTVCGAIEGNNWFVNREETYYQLNKANYAIGDRYCEKAETANIGGVIGRNMRDFFCQGNTP